MPRFDGSYPNLGLEYSPLPPLNKTAVPQVESVFADGSDGDMSGLSTTGGRSLDPSPYVDIKDDISGAVTATIVNGFFGSDPNNPMGFTCPNLTLRSGGSGMQASVQPGIGSGWWTEIRFTDGNDGYLVRLESGLLGLYRMDGGIATLLGSAGVGTTTEKVLSLTCDDGQKFKAYWGDEYITEIDDTYGVLGLSMSLVSKGGSVRSFIAGVTKGASFDTVDAPFRGAYFTNILYYDGVNFPWVADSSTVFDAGLLNVTGVNAIPFVTLAYCKPAFLTGDATPAGSPGTSFVDDVVSDWVELLDGNPTLSNFIVWKDNYGMRCGSDSDSSYFDGTPGCTLDHWDYPRYRNLYQQTYDGLIAANPTAMVYGPNCHLAARSEGYDSDYSGVMIDSRDMDFLESFISDATAATPITPTSGIAVSGSFTSTEWGLLIPYLKSLIDPLPLIITSPPSEATPTQTAADDYMEVMNDNLDEGDVAFYDYSGFFFHSPRLTLGEYDWTFTATLVIPDTMVDARLKVVAIADKVLKNGAVSIVSDHATPYQLTEDLPIGNQYIALGDLPEATYSITIFGDKGENGNAMLRIGIYSDNYNTLTLADTRYLGS